jgi:chromosomal replication initiator protein
LAGLGGRKKIAPDIYKISFCEMNAQNTPGGEAGHAPALQDKIIASVAGFYGISTAQIKRRTRRPSIAVPRQIAMYLLRDVMGLSYHSIGRIFSLDHSTVVHACQKIKRSRSADVRLNSEIQQITDAIQRD